MSIMSHQQDDEVVINLWEVVKLMLSKAPAIICCTLAFGLITYAGAFFLLTPQYEANVTLYVNNKTSVESTTTVTTSDLNASIQLVDTYAAFITSKTMMKEVIEAADVDIEVKELQEKVTTSTVNDTEVFKVTVMDSDPKAAARIANAIADIAPDRISEIVEGSSVKVVDYADIPEEIASPHYLRLTAIGMILGCMLSAAVVFIRALLDTTIQSEADFAQWSYPILSTIPDLDEARKRKGNGYGYGSYGSYGSKA